MRHGSFVRRLRRFAAGLTAVSMMATGTVLLLATPAGAAVRAFTPVFSTNTTGDVMVRGNTLMTCPDGSFSLPGGTVSCSSVQNGTVAGANNGCFMSYVDTDSDSSTFDSSSSTITIPTGATVLYAGLSWSGTAGAGSLTGYPALTGAVAPSSASKNTVKFKVPGGSYSTLTSAAVDSTGSGYQGFKDVTTAVSAAGSGTYTVANVQAGTGGGNYAGWSLAVAYRDPTQPNRNLVIYSGFTNVSNGGATSIPITGFKTPLSGSVVTRLGTVTYEGDRGNVGDSMSLGSNAISNALNPANDIQNSSVTDLGVALTDRTPSYNNTLGVDIDRFDATGFLSNGQTSTTINLKTVGDTYYPALVTLATNLYAPSLQATKTVKDVTRGITGAVQPGDVLAYSLAISNVGGDGSTASILTDAVPTGTSYVAGSLLIGGTAVTDASGDDAGNVSSGTVTARLGSGATASAGGTMATNASTTVAFKVTVNAGVANGTVLSNAAALGYNSATLGTSYVGTSNTVSSTVSVINVNPVLAFPAPPSGEVSVAYTNTLTAAGGTSPYAWAVTAGSLPAGLTLDGSSGVISGTPTASGIYPFTVSTTDANGQVATESTSIYIAPPPGLTYPTPLQSADLNATYTFALGVNPGTGPYTWSLSAGTLPTGLSLDTSTGVISGTPTASGTRSFTVKVVDVFGASATEATSLAVVAGPTLSNAAAPAGEVTAPYSYGLSATGGVTPYLWAVTSGTLPAGITLDSSAGLLSGTPTAAGTSNFTVTATDVNGASASQALSITVIAGPAVAFTPPIGEVGAAYTAQPTGSGGTSPYTWAVSAGALPAGLSISASTGAITGTPSAAGTSNVTVQATDSKGVTATQAGTITVVAAPALTFPPPPAAELGASYSDQLTGSGGIGPFTWTVSVGSLPAGLTLTSDTGLLSGTPTAVGTSTFTVRLVDSNGLADTRQATMVVNRTTSTVSLSAPVSVQFGNTVTLTAPVSPSGAAGTVTFTDVPTTGPQNGTTVTLGTATVSTGTASVTTTLPAFGVNTITAVYGGDATHTAATSATRQVEVSAYAGEVIVTEFRTSGPGGANDSYVELLNTGPTVPLAGIRVISDSGAVSTLPANAGLLGTGRSYLLTGTAFSLGAIATSDFTTTIGSGGIKVIAPDSAGTQTDAVGPSGGFHLGTSGLPAMTGTPTAQYAWVRTELAGKAVDTRDNAADFQLVSTTPATLIGGVRSTLGSPSPTGTADPYQHNATLQSTLLDSGKAAGSTPNRVVVSGSPGKLVVRRTIINTTGQTVTTAKVRFSAISEQYGAPEPGVATQPTTVAWIRGVNVSPSTEQVTLTGGTTVTVQDLSVDAPNVSSGGGLNSTFTVPLPDGGLSPGASINVAFTFDVITHGTFWFGYDVDAITGSTPAAQMATQMANRVAGRVAGRMALQAVGRPSARRSTLTATRDTGVLR